MLAVSYIMYQLISKHQNSLQGQFSVAKAEKLFKAWTQEVHNKNIVVTLDTKPLNVWNSSCRRKQNASYSNLKKMKTLNV